MVTALRAPLRLPAVAPQGGIPHSRRRGPTEALGACAPPGAGARARGAGARPRAAGAPRARRVAGAPDRDRFDRPPPPAYASRSRLAGSSGKRNGKPRWSRLLVASRALGLESRLASCRARGRRPGARQRPPAAAVDVETADDRQLAHPLVDGLE